MKQQCHVGLLDVNLYQSVKVGIIVMSLPQFVASVLFWTCYSEISRSLEILLLYQFYFVACW